MRAVDAGLEQWAVNSLFGRTNSAVFALGGSDTHQGASGSLHYRTDVGEI